MPDGNVESKFHANILIMSQYTSICTLFNWKITSYLNVGHMTRFQFEASRCIFESCITEKATLKSSAWSIEETMIFTVNQKLMFKILLTARNLIDVSTIKLFVCYIFCKIFVLLDIFFHGLSLSLKSQHMFTFVSKSAWMKSKKFSNFDEVTAPMRWFPWSVS